MKRHLREREKLAEERTRRRRALLDQAAGLRQQIGEQAQECAALAAEAARTPGSERVAAQVERLQAAQGALELAARLLSHDDPDGRPIVGGQPQPSARELHAQLSEQLGRWYRMGEGWWEARIIWRPQITIALDPATRQPTLDVVLFPFGPYYYRHWRQDGRQQTIYLGRERPRDFSSEDDIALPEPEPLREVGRLVRQACELVERLQEAQHAIPGKTRRKRRLQGVVRRALRRAQRRLRAEVQERS